MIEILPFLKYFKKPILNGAQELTDEINQILDNKLPNYLESIVEKFGKINTFYHRQKRIPFYDIYYPINLRTRDKLRIELNTISNLFEESKFCALIGSAGSGKSMMFKHLFLNCLKERNGIPILIELRSLNKFNGSLKDYIIELITEYNLSTSKKILDRMLASGQFIFLFDGYDEIYQDKLETISNDILHFIDLYNKNKFIISSRPEANIELLPRFENFYLNRLTELEAKEFSKIQLNIRKGNINEEFIESVLDVIENNKEVKAYFKNPLLLSMFLFVFELNHEVPNKKSEFYDYVFLALCSEHNSLSKPGFVFPKKSNLSNSQLREILELFSFKTFFKGDFIFKRNEILNELKEITNKKYNGLIFNEEKVLNDYLVAIPVIIKEGLEFKFPHRSLQEYFAASFIKNLDTKTKEKIYSKNFISLAQKGTDSFNNFWNLCSEIDQNAFYLYFIIPTLEKFLNDIKSKDNKITIENLFALISLSLKLKFKINYTYSDGIASNEYIDSNDCEIIRTEWSSKFDVYKKVLSYLGLFKLYSITDLVEPRLIISLADENQLRLMELPFINNIDTKTEIVDEDSQEYFERQMRINIENNNPQDELIFNEHDTIVITFEINKLIPDLYYFSNQSKISNVVFDTINNVESYLNNVKKNIQTNIDFNDNLLDDILS